jgi:hypothetical protein
MKGVLKLIASSNPDLKLPNKYFFYSLIPSRWYKAGFILIFILIASLKPADHLLYAQNSNQKIHLVYKNNLLSITANDADLKNVLSKLADKADIFMRFPNSLKKKISIETGKISLGEALQRLLKGLNYAIIYSSPSGNDASVLKVFVFKKTKKNIRLSGHERRIANRIRAYERQIESYKNRLSGIDANSSRGKNYQRRIKRLENSIETLERQLR